MAKKLEEVEWIKDHTGSTLPNAENRVKMRDLLNETGPGFCLAKWTQVTMHLGNGLTHSCHHPHAHKIPLDELKDNPSALHNTIFKKQRRKEMLTGKRPTECDFCWRVEDNGEISDRVLKSLPSFSSPHYNKIKDLDGDEDIYPTYVEVSFGNTCNFACAYCGPAFSSKWQQDVEKNGAYTVLNEHYNAINKNEVHIPNREENPYIEAFWKWFPEAYKHMHTFRITGGEPLLLKDTFKVMDFLAENPNPVLEFSINTNACPPGDKWNEFVKKVNYLTENNCIKKFDLFVSAEATGDRCDYIRDGMDWKMFKTNVEYFLENTTNTRVNFMAAFNILSLSTLKELLEWVLELKKIHSWNGMAGWFEEKGFIKSIPGSKSYKDRKGKQHSRVGIDIPYVRSPTFLDANITSKELVKKYLIPALEFMYENVGTPDFYGTNKFEDWECLKLKRNVVDLILKTDQLDEDGLHTNKEMKLTRGKFANFIQQYDKRRNKKFLEVFPEYEEFYNTCITEYQAIWGTDKTDVTFEKYKQQQLEDTKNAKDIPSK
tara:strand:+ start:135 stop:1766 length:1632 start_codon:yes stop_codon:yes gene_type:complete